MKGAEIMKVYIGYRSVMYMEGFFEKNNCKNDNYIKIFLI